MTSEPPRRRALLLGCGTFADSSLAALRSPHRDVEELERVLRDPDNCRYTVTSQVDCTSQRAQREIEGFFSTARVTDTMNLLYLSCHGVQDKQGRLYFAFADTERALLGSTAVSAEWVRECIHSSRSKATLVLVDCCFSGAFIKGMRARSSGANVETLVHDMPHGSGVAVLTASGDTEASFEDADSVVVRPSYFTDALITGISSGAADLNRDGRVTVDELYDYIYDQVTRGPSPQRPRRLGVGEGVLVVSDAVRSASSSSSSSPLAAEPVIQIRPAERRTDEPRETTLVAQGVLGWVSFDGQWIVIGKSGVGHIYKGERRFHVSQLSGVAVKAATRLHYGFLQVILPGVAPEPVIRFGPHAGRPPMTDDNSISFAKSANEAIDRLRTALQDAIDAAHGRTRPVRPDTPRGQARPALSPAEGDSLSTPKDAADCHRQPEAAPPSDPQADHRRGEADGAEAAHRLPLAALDGLILQQFDVVRWLGPWRQYWETLNQQRPAAFLPSWLPEFARYLGGHAAPSGSTNSAFIPSPAYLAGFCAGIRDVWNESVTSRLLPPDRPTFAQLLTQPFDNKVTPPLPFSESTIEDLISARRRARRAATTRTALRITLWVITGLLAIFEIGAIAVTIQGSWTDPDGTRSTDQAPNAILANLSCLIPLIGLSALIMIDLRRSKRKKATPPQSARASR